MQIRSFPELMRITKEQFQMNSKEVHADRWQGMTIKGRPDFVSYELLNYSFTVPLDGEEDLDFYRESIVPNLPWADDHFQERVSGHPINPGKEWANWPWGASAAKHRQADAKFNHNYMERYFPKFARTDFLTPEGRIPDNVVLEPHKGIVLPYGDMQDVVDYLVREPTTRQAWIPIFFPEDTGYADGGRKPCTLGYQFIMRDGKLHVYYPLRSCDFVRHFRDDIYLTIRLLLWVLEGCRKQDPETWNQITPGTYTMHCTSLHIFTNDWAQLFGKPRGK